MVIATLEKGGFFGEMAPLLGDVRSMTIIAVGNVYLWKLSLDEMFQYMQDDARVMRAVYTELAERTRKNNLLIKDLILKERASRK